jgi:prepilin peptidase CpaA
VIVEGDLGKLVGVLLVLAFPCLLIVAALGDVIQFRISNGLNLIVALLYLATAVWMGIDVVIILWHLGAGATVLVSGIILFSLGVIGGGDVKLLAACGCWTGFATLPLFLITVALAGGILAIVLLLLRLGISKHVPEASPLARLMGRNHDVPYGVAIAVGGFVILPSLTLVEALSAV